MHNLKAVFRSISSYKLQQEVNEIIFCTDDDIEGKQSWGSSLEEGAKRLNALAKRRKLQTGELIDVTNLISCLKITA
jgi:hypothetical protein